MADINVKLKGEEKINIKLKPAQGIQVGMSKAYIFDESMLDKYFVFEQAVSSDEWTITHNLGKHPSVTVVDTADNVIWPVVQYIDDNSCVVRFNAATKGKAYLN